MATAKRKTRRDAFEFPCGWGGRRKGAGPKPKGERPGVSHRTRAPLAARFPVHVTLRLAKGLPSLRRRREHALVLGAFTTSCARAEFRCVQYSVQSNHVHLLCEARDRPALSRGVQGLSIRIAARLNRLWQRRGRTFADRYHDRILRSPREVRCALAYVLNNARKHGVALRVDRLDPYSSGRWFDGWRGRAAAFDGRCPLPRARTWLLAVGWRRHGEVPLSEVPGACRGIATRARA